MEAVGSVPLQGTTSAQSAPRLGYMTNTEPSVQVPPHGGVTLNELPNGRSASGATSGSGTSLCTTGVFNSSQQPVEENVTTKHGHLKSRGKKCRKRHRRENRIDDAQFSLPSLKGHRKDKSGHRKSRDGSATHRSRDDQLHHRRNSRSEDIKPEDTVNVDSLNQPGSKKLSSDPGATGAVAALSPVEKMSKKKKKKRKKLQKLAESEHLSEMSNPADAKNGPKVIDKPTQEVSSPKDAVAVVKPSDAAAVRETQVDTSLQTDEAHQAVLTEAVSKERGVPQAGNDVSSDDRQHPFEDLSKAASAKSKLKRTLPATGGPFGGLSSTRSSSLDRSVERRYSNVVSMAVEKNTLSLLPEQTSSTIANDGEAHVEQPGRQDMLSPKMQVSEVKLSMPDHAGGLCTTISETEKEHSDMSGIHQPSGKHAGDEYSPAAPKRSSPILHYEPDTGRRVSVTIPKWGGPFGGSTADEVSESLHDQEATRKAEAKSSPPQKSPLDMAPFTPDEVKKEETTLPPDHGLLSPPTIQKKVARHVLEESVFTELSGDSEERLYEQQRKASQSSLSSAESSAFKSSQGSFVQSPHSKVDNDVNTPRRVRSMSLVLLEDAPSLLSKPINTASSPASVPPDVVVSLPKLEGADFCQQLPILPTKADQTEKSDKEAKSEVTKKAGTREMTSSVTPLSKDGHDPEKPAPAFCQSRAHSVDEMNKRIEVLRYQPFKLEEAGIGSHTPLRPVNFKQDHAVLTDKGEVKLCLDLSTREEVEMLWPFDIEARMAKREDA